MLVPTEFVIPEEWINIANTTLIDIDHKLSINKPTGNFFYDPWVIKDEYKNTVWEQLLSVLPNDIGEARLIKLAPGTTYMAHADIDDRYHLNIKSNCAYLIDLNNEKMFKLLPDCIWYDMNAGLIHAATNFGSTDRVQLVVRKLLNKNILKNPVPVTISVVSHKFDYRYVFDQHISPWLNYANKNNLINDFSFYNDIVKMNVESSEIEKLKLILPDIFELT